MVSIISQPYSSANFSYSSSMGQNSVKQNRQFTYADMDEYVFKQGKVYKEIKEDFPNLPEDRYRRMLKVKHYESDSKRMQRRIDTDILELHSKGVVPEKIAEKYEWSLSYCKNRLRNLGVSFLVVEKPQPIPESIIQEIRIMAEEKGMSQPAIAKKLKKGIEFIREIMHDNEIYTPAMKRAEKIGDLKKSTIAAALEQFGNNIKEASKSLGVSVAMFKKHAAQFHLI